LKLKLSKFFSKQSGIEKVIVECLSKNNIEIEKIISSFNFNNKINGKQNILIF
jgi:hypothetical protein